MHHADTTTSYEFVAQRQTASGGSALATGPSEADVTELVGGHHAVTDTCPRCRCRALVVEGYRVPGLDRLVTQAFCTSCGFVASEPGVTPLPKTA
jgi:hypothetical protein